MSNTSILKLLKRDLLAARKAKDGLRVSALQSVLTRVTNAEAVPTDGSSSISVGVGTTEVARRVLSEQDVRQILQDEIDELQGAISQMAAHQDNSYASELKQKSSIIQTYLMLPRV
jgi:uncharacterized protein